MGIQIANVWHLGLRLTNTVFEPYLGELYKNTQFASKFAYLRSKIDFFWGVGGGGAQPPP